MGQIFPTASLHRDHSILHALVCEKEISHMGKINGNSDLVCEKNYFPTDNCKFINSHNSASCVRLV